MFGFHAAGRQKFRLAPGAEFLHEFAGKRAVLDLAQHIFHFLAGLFGDQAAPGAVVAVFRSVGNGIAHHRKAAGVDEVYDELHLVDAFKICHLRLIARLYQRIKAGLHQFGDAAAQHSLLAKQVGLRLFTESGFQNARTARADAAGIGQRVILRPAGYILVYRDQAGHTLALYILAAHGVAGAFGRYHDNVYILRRLDQVKVDVEAVGKHQYVALFQVGGNLGRVNIRRQLIRHQHHNKIARLGCLVDLHDLQAGLFRLFPAGRALAKAYHYVYPGLLQVLRMRMALAAIADDGNGLAVQQPQVAIVVIVFLNHFKHPSFFGFFI